jgi:hypothetical protein
MLMRAAWQQYRTRIAIQEWERERQRSWNVANPAIEREFADRSDRTSDDAHLSTCGEDAERNRKVKGSATLA